LLYNAAGVPTSCQIGGYHNTKVGRMASPKTVITLFLFL